MLDEMSTNNRTKEPEELEVDVTEESNVEELDSLRYEISYYPSDMTLRVYYEKYKDKQLVIPDFQREYVWDLVQASKLIESFLIGIPVPGVFLYKEHKTNKLLVIDGQQRILSIIRYLEGRFDDRVFRLKNVMPPWAGKTYDELSDADRYQLQDSVLRATVVQQTSPNDYSSLYHIFERLNTGGVSLSPMEIRKCVYAGPTFKLFEDLNRLHTWRKLIGKTKPDRRLRDVELILRIIALSDNWVGYEKPMKSFLNSYLIKSQTLAKEALSKRNDQVRRVFSKACEHALEQLGEKPFHLRGRLNLGLMDCTLSTLCSYPDKSNKKLQQDFRTMLKDPRFLEAVTHSTSDASVVLERFRLAAQYLVGITIPHPSEPIQHP
jgi:hypothetical protein